MPMGIGRHYIIRRDITTKLYIVHYGYIVEVKNASNNDILINDPDNYHCANPYYRLVNLTVVHGIEGLDGGGGGVLNSFFNKNIDINSVFGKYKVNTSKYLFDKM